MHPMRIVSLLLSWMALVSLALGQTAPEGPVNVLFIMADQHSAHALGCYGNGFGGVQQSLTPNLDQLADEGVRFTNAFSAQAQCSPSRFSVITGQWPHNHGVRWNHIWEPLTGEETFPTLARDAGYATATFGKHHFYWLEQSRPFFADHGFDEVRDLDDYRTYCLANGTDIYRAPGLHWAMSGTPALITPTGFTFNTNDFHPAGYITNEVLGFLDDRAGSSGDGQPFACWYALEGPHPPLLPSGPADPHDWAHMYHPFEALELAPNFGKVATTARLAQQQAIFAGVTENEWREYLSYYYGLITQIDWNIGRVLQRLDELGLRDNTVVIYTADHGEMASEMATWSKGAGSYDGTGRIPLIVRFPGVAKAGITMDTLTSNIDFFPTLAELTGVPMTEERRRTLDGRSLVNVLVEGETPEDWRQTVFSEFGPSHPNRHRMARTHTAKFSIDHKEGMQTEFYDLVNDPWELFDRSADSDLVVQQTITTLRGRLAAWWNGEQGHAPKYATTGIEFSVPSSARVPFPRNGELEIARDVDLSWLPSTSAERQELFFGTDSAALPLVQVLGPMEGQFNPGTLAVHTTYYWRVDGTNDNGLRSGELWSFTTGSSGAGGPGLAKMPGPAHRANGVHFATGLNWQPASGANSQVLYFGEASQPLVATPLASGASALTPPLLNSGGTYHWRVDSTDSEGTTVGDVWEFTTATTGLPGKAVAVAPMHLEGSVGPTAQLVFTPGTGADQHDIYFGASFPLHLVSQQAATTFNPGTLQLDTVYYWRVDEVNSRGTRLGEIWRFQTATIESCVVGSSFCFGNACPCGNDDPLAGCRNSTGRGALLAGCGTTSATDDNLVLAVEGLTPHQFSLFVMGNSPNQLAFGDGWLCLSQGAGTVCRLGVAYGGLAGHAVYGPGLVARSALLGGECKIDPGETWHFQVWYRDASSLCGSGTNLSNGLTVTFAP